MPFLHSPISFLILRISVSFMYKWFELVIKTWIPDKLETEEILYWYRITILAALKAWALLLWPMTENHRGGNGRRWNNFTDWDFDSIKPWKSSPSPGCWIIITTQYNHTILEFYALRSLLLLRENIQSPSFQGNHTTLKNRNKRTPSTLAYKSSFNE